MSMKTEIEKRAKEIGDAHAFPVDNLKEAFGSHGMIYRQWLVGMSMSAAYAGIVDHPASPHNSAQESVRKANAICMALAESEVQNV